jgi:hypothetical protein
LKTASNTSIGEAAITSRNSHILTIRTIASTTNGINKTRAKNNFIIKSKKSQAIDSPGAALAKSEKFSIELYIVIKGHTNHLDFSKIFVNVNFVLLVSPAVLKRASSFFRIQYHRFLQLSLKAEKSTGIILQSLTSS